MCSLAQNQINPRGDANCDGSVDITDLNTLVDSILHGKDNYWCDINYDGVIDIFDVSSSVNIITGKSNYKAARPSGTLPTVWINVENNSGITSKEYYLNASLYVTYPDGTTQGDIDSPYSMKIKGRGNSTWDLLAKKPYKIKFPKNIPFLGMSKEKTFTLLPNYLDWWGYLQNTVGFELSRRLGLAYTPNQVPVELVLNGNYIGLYFATEQIKIGPNRVNIEAQADEITDDTDVTGGWLIEIDNYPDDDSFKIYEHDNRAKQNLWFTSHSPEKMSNVQREYIYNYINTVDSLIYLSPLDSASWTKYIDVDELAKFAIVNEILDNKEAFSGSCWMYKEKGDSSKLKFGPVWDFGSSFINVKLPVTETCYNSYICDELPNYCSTHWIGQMYKYPYFMETVKKHWVNFYDNNYEGLYSFMDEFVDSILDAGAADYVRWPQSSSNLLRERKDQFFIPSIKCKVNWLNKQWGNISH